MTKRRSVKPFLFDESLRALPCRSVDLRLCAKQTCQLARGYCSHVGRWHLPSQWSRRRSGLRRCPCHPAEPVGRFMWRVQQPLCGAIAITTSVEAWSQRWWPFMTCTQPCSVVGTLAVGRRQGEQPGSYGCCLVVAGLLDPPAVVMRRCVGHRGNWKNGATVKIRRKRPARRNAVGQLEVHSRSHDGGR